MNETKPYRLDIRGKICPMTFVYTKLQLEKMKAGELLEIILDFPAAVKNVPDNCKRQGIGELINIQTLDDTKEWILLIK
ncbi:MAG: sulfurtransferase TusA family protein, partial [Candidatus Heimdallarchaeota archaeon]